MIILTFKMHANVKLWRESKEYCVFLFFIIEQLFNLNC